MIDAPAKVSAKKLDSDTLDQIALRCDAVVGIGKLLGALREQRENLYESRKPLADELWALVGADMARAGQRSMKVGKFRIDVGYEAQRICACHGAIAGDCDTVGDTKLYVASPRPFIFVSEVSE